MVRKFSEKEKIRMLKTVKRKGGMDLETFYKGAFYKGENFDLDNFNYKKMKQEFGYSDKEMEMLLELFLTLEDLEKLQYKVPDNIRDKVLIMNSDKLNSTIPREKLIIMAGDNFVLNEAQSMLSVFDSIKKITNDPNFLEKVKSDFNYNTVKNKNNFSDVHMKIILACKFDQKELYLLESEGIITTKIFNDIKNNQFSKTSKESSKRTQGYLIASNEEAIIIIIMAFFALLYFLFFK